MMATRNKKPSTRSKLKFTLFPGEKIDFGNSESETRATNEELNRRYVKGDVRIVTEQARYPLSTILEMLKETVKDDRGKVTQLRYMLDPEYQRRHRWATDRKSRLIESFLMNVPVPPIFLYERGFARYEVMDGRQRLTTLKEFYSDDLELEGLEHWSDLNGKTYSQLPSKVRDGIDRRYISATILLTETAKSEKEAARLKKLVFERLNSGGVKLSSQETRNAVFDGPLNRLCLKLSKDPKFREMWRMPREDMSTVPEDEENSDDVSRKGQTLYEEM
ncbi:MAG: DUF262 domain-containing protein, partial [Bacteroidota bacterium]